MSLPIYWDNGLIEKSRKHIYVCINSWNKHFYFAFKETFYVL